MNLDKKREATWDETVDRPFAGMLERYGRKLLVRCASLFLRLLPSIPPSSSAKFSLDQAKRILLIKEPYRMGDSVQITPTLRALRKYFPEHYLGIVVQDRNMLVFQYNTDVDEIFIYKKKEINRAPWKALEFINHIRKRKWDLAVTLETQRTHLTNDLIAYLSGAFFRLRYDGEAFGDIESNVFYNLLSPFDPAMVHEVDKNFNVFRMFGLKLDDPTLLVKVSEKELNAAREILRSIFGNSDVPFIVLHPGAYQIVNRWTLENYLKVAEKIKEKGIKLLFILGPSEKNMQDEIVRAGIPVISDLSILELGAILSLSRLVLCNDTGIMHIAAGIGTKTVALFGKMDPLRWRPPGNLVNAVRSPDHKTSSISVGDVLQVLLSQLS